MANLFVCALQIHGEHADLESFIKGESLPNGGKSTWNGAIKTGEAQGWKVNEADDPALPPSANITYSCKGAGNEAEVLAVSRLHPNLVFTMAAVDPLTPLAYGQAIKGGDVLANTEFEGDAYATELKTRRGRKRTDELYVMMDAVEAALEPAVLAAMQPTAQMKP